MYGELIMDAVPDKVSENFFYRREGPVYKRKQLFLF